MKNTEQRIEIMKAYLEGAQIEYAHLGSNGPEDCWLVVEKNSDPAWDWQKFDYRIHPLTDAELLEKIRHIISSGGNAVSVVTEIEMLLNPETVDYDEEEYDPSQDDS